GAENRPVIHTVLPLEGAIGINGVYASFTGGTVDGGGPGTFVERRAIPGGGRDVARTTLRTITSTANTQGPDRTIAQRVTLEGVEDTVFVDSTDHWCAAVGEECRRGTKIAVAGTLRGGNLPGI